MYTPPSFHTPQLQILTVAKEDQIDKKTLEIKPIDGEVYTDMQELSDEMPDNTPRYILLSYPLTLVWLYMRAPTRYAWRGLTRVSRRRNLAD